MVPWNGARTKVQIKLTIQRLRTLQEKKLALAKKSRRDIADLLLKNRVETARIRTEGLIQDDIYVELLELLELYSELLQARFNLLDISTASEPEASIADAVHAIVYAAPRTELKELQVLREMLMHKYGRNFSLALQPSDSPPSIVPERIRSKLALYTPERELVDAYLYEIAKGYNVNWIPEPPKSSESRASTDGEDGDVGGNGGNGGDGDIGPDGGIKQKLKEAIEGREDEVEDEKDEKKEKKVDYPADTGKDAWAGEGDQSSSAFHKATTTTIGVPTAQAKTNGGGAKKLTEEEELAQRFERLKNLR